MRTPITVLTLTLTLGGFLTACGQKGPLYLPQDPARPGTAPAPAAPVSSTPGTDSGQSPTAPQDEEDRKPSSPQHTEAEAVSK